MTEFISPLFSEELSEKFASSIKINKKLISCSAVLGELRGIGQAIPNEKIILDALPLQEAEDSSAIENIVTTQDVLYKERIGLSNLPSEVKEVTKYREAMALGHNLILQDDRVIRISTILEIQKRLLSNNAGIRIEPGTVVGNSHTGEIIWTPPQNYETIKQHLDNLMKYINNGASLHPLVKLALIHHEFESIHPFYDGNGRTGRIINILYLISQGLLRSPILYISRFINHNPLDYYRLLSEVQNGKYAEEWVIYILTAIEMTAKQVIETVNKIIELLKEYKTAIRNKHSFYRQELINHIFYYPYTKREFLARDLNVTRITAAKYLDILADDGILKKVKKGKYSYYVNVGLTDILFNLPSLAIKDNAESYITETTTDTNPPPATPNASTESIAETSTTDTNPPPATPNASTESITETSTTDTNPPPATPNASTESITETSTTDINPPPATPQPIMLNIADNLAKLRQQVNLTLEANSRSADSLLIIAVSKTHPASYIEAAYAAGQQHFAENYMQEAVDKIQQLGSLPLTWHFIGHLQSNKARLAAENFDWVHSVSSLKLARKLNEYRSPTAPALNICVQVNISREDNKSGIIPEEVVAFCAELQNFERLSLRGLMAIIENTDDTAKQKEYFSQMHQLFIAVKQKLAPAKWDTLSMGMSADMISAIEEGATMIRIGSAIFGSRQVSHQ